MPYPPRSPTTQAVGAALKRAGVPRSEPTMGLGEHTAGYKVRKGQCGPGTVEVTWLPHSLDSPPSRGNHQLRLLRCADILLLAGFQPRLEAGGEKLTVYARLR